MQALRMLALVVVPVVAALLVGGCSDDKVEHPGNGELDAFYTQQVKWVRCVKSGPSDWFPDAPADGRRCARILAPLNYHAIGRPAPDSGSTVSLAVARLPAEAEKHGTLLLISGGPGGTGLSMLDMAFPEQIRRHYDIVSYDPRGVGRSTPRIWCDPTGADRTEYSDSVAATEAWRRAFVYSCMRGTASKVLEHIGSDEAADDIDVLRGVLGESQLNILAVSYGTQVAAMYIDRFPHGYRAAVLDGVVDVAENNTQMRVGQEKGFQETFDRVAAFCVGRYRAEGHPDCPLGDDPDQAQNVFRGILRDAKDHPVPAGAARAVEPIAILRALIASYLWPEGWAPYLDALGAVRHGDGAPMRKLASSETGLAYWTSDMYENALEVITCADIAAPTDDRAARQADEAAVYDAATFDDYEPRRTEFPLDICDFWPFSGTAKGFRPHRADASAPVLLVGTRHDPTTPLRNAERMADYLASPLLTREGDGHAVVFDDVNQCIDGLVVRYLLDPSSARNAVCE
ncbi:alpha/beta hydrolase [Nocardia sp. NPDC050175]|uniref:alpha/beta hydrolase n=1 Tax=Nocardia sp. NPDC050175 TaxID=3364317 RepID=UPI0037896A75